MAADRVTRVSVSTAGRKDRVTRVRSRAAQAFRDRVTLVRARATPITVFAASITVPVFNSTPFELEEFAAVTTLPADSFQWSVVAGSPVLVGATNTAGVVAQSPALPVASTITLMATAKLAGSPDATATVTYAVAPHAGLFRIGGDGIWVHR